MHHPDIRFFERLLVLKDFPQIAPASYLPDIRAQEIETGYILYLFTCSSYDLEDRMVAHEVPGSEHKEEPRARVVQQQLCNARRMRTPCIVLNVAHYRRSNFFNNPCPLATIW